MKTPALRVLLIEDDSADAILVERNLRRCQHEFTIEHCRSLQDSIDVLEHRAFDVGLMDLSLPDSFGLEGLDRLRDVAPELPVVVLTGLCDEAIALASLERGAQDYIVKGSASAELLDRTLRYAIQRQQIQSENRRLLRLSEALARQDPLTGVLNRHSFSESLKREWSRATRHETDLACVVLDIDFFKRINDSFGHAAGDRAIKMLADLLTHVSRAEDYVCRLGGEEFCVLLPETREADAVTWAERLRTEVTQLVIPAQPDDIRITASIGVAALGDAVQKPQDLIDRADEAMFAAKQSGRDQVVSFGRLRKSAGNEALTHWNRITLGQLMQPMRHSLAETHSLVEAVRLMEELGVDMLPVVGEQGELTGVVGYEELMAAGSLAGELQGCVTDVMHTQPITYTPATSPREVCEFLCRAAVRQVFVTQQRRPLGWIGRAEFVNWFRASTRPRPSQTHPSQTHPSQMHPPQTLGLEHCATPAVAR